MLVLSSVPVSSLNIAGHAMMLLAPEACTSCEFPYVSSKGPRQ